MMKILFYFFALIFWVLPWQIMKTFGKFDRD